jgi:hypothetical protein
MTDDHEKALEAAAFQLCPVACKVYCATCVRKAQAAVQAYLAAREAAGFVEASKVQITNLAQQIETLAYENGTLKAIVQGWHYLAIGPDEMGDYYTHKQLVKASEPYASPAIKAIARPRGEG